MTNLKLNTNSFLLLSHFFPKMLHFHPAETLAFLTTFSGLANRVIAAPSIRQYSKN